VCDGADPTPGLSDVSGSSNDDQIGRHLVRNGKERIDGMPGYEARGHVDTRRSEWGTPGTLEEISDRRFGRYLIDAQLGFGLQTVYEMHASTRCQR